MTFNQIDDISGLKFFKKSSHSLHHVQLYSNRLNSLTHVIESLSQCTCLQNIEFRNGKNVNPINGIPAYRTNILTRLPWLKQLDGTDKNGNKISNSSHASDIPG